jgi:hypothetical protein
MDAHRHVADDAAAASPALDIRVTATLAAIDDLFALRDYRGGAPYDAGDDVDFDADEFASPSLDAE